MIMDDPRKEAMITLRGHAPRVVIVFFVFYGSTMLTV